MEDPAIKSSSSLKEIVISADQAVFWMDEQGRWCNAHGPFEHRKIIDYFNACLRKDSGGFYVEQVRDNLLEKVYFRYKDTAIFAVEIIETENDVLVLNTGVKIPLDINNLFVEDDTLYQKDGDDRIKFNDRVMLKLANRIKFENDGYFFCSGRNLVSIPLLSKDRD